MTSSADIPMSIEVECQSCDALTPATFTLTDEMVEPLALELFTESWTGSRPVADTAMHLWEISPEHTRAAYRDSARRYLRLAFSTTNATGDDDGHA